MMMMVLQQLVSRFGPGRIGNRFVRVVLQALRWLAPSSAAPASPQQMHSSRRQVRHIGMRQLQLAACFFEVANY
jgi:hypothetical protein